MRVHEFLSRSIFIFMNNFFFVLLLCLFISGFYFLCWLRNFLAYVRYSVKVHQVCLCSPKWLMRAKNIIFVNLLLIAKIIIFTLSSFLVRCVRIEIANWLSRKKTNKNPFTRKTACASRRKYIFARLTANDVYITEPIQNTWESTETYD